MRHAISIFSGLFVLAGSIAFSSVCCSAEGPLDLKISWQKNMLKIEGENLPGKQVDVWYLEAYVRAGSTDREWGKSVIKHETEMISRSEDGKEIILKCRLADGVICDHTIKVVDDGVSFQVTAHNPTEKVSEAHWAQPCIRLDRFTGEDKESYLRKSFIFLDGKLERMPTRHWATEARYVPGQVWCPKGVDRNDVNPRPLSKLVPSNGLIGCYSADEKMILATAWEPYQELFQGVITCLHSDFRIGGLEPNETKKMRGRIYIIPADEKNLLKRYTAEFPEQQIK